MVYRKNTQKPIQLMLIVMLALGSYACEQQDSSDIQTQTTGVSNNDLNNPVLVHVNGEPITRRDLDVSLLRSVAPEKINTLDDEARQRALEGLVISRIISQVATKEISKQDIDHIDRQAQQYREELLVKHYLKAHVEPEPVSQEMVETFYQENLHRFGGGDLISYQLLTTEGRPHGAQRADILRILNGANAVKDWSAFVKDAEKKGHGLRLQSGASDDKLLHKQMLSVIKSLRVSETSKPFFLEGKPYIIRVVNVKQREARPLAEVSGQIRRALAPLRLKDTIKALSDEMLKTSTVRYVEDTDQNK